MLNEAKIMCCCINNLVQAQDNNANGIHAKAYLLWDFHVLCESKPGNNYLMRRGIAYGMVSYLKLAKLK